MFIHIIAIVDITVFLAGSAHWYIKKYSGLKLNQNIIFVFVIAEFNDRSHTTR